MTAWRFWPVRKHAILNINILSRELQMEQKKWVGENQEKKNDELSVSQCSFIVPFSHQLTQIPRQSHLLEEVGPTSPTIFIFQLQADFLDYIKYHLFFNFSKILWNFTHVGIWGKWIFFSLWILHTYLPRHLNMRRHIKCVFPYSSLSTFKKQV
jgi:hypothetical protein